MLQPYTYRRRFCDVSVFLVLLLNLQDREYQDQQLEVQQSYEMKTR